MSALREPGEDALARVAAYRKASPMARWLDLSARIEDGRLRYRLAFHERHIGNPLIRALHGGVVSAFLETCATLEVTARVDVRVRTISVHANYLRGAVDKDMEGEVAVARLGRRIAFLEATGWQTGREEPVCRAAVALRVWS